MGPPGSGKGTISARIVNDFTLKHLSAGDLLRNQVKKKTDLGQEASQFMSSGKLVPDNLVVQLMLAELVNMSRCNWLLDGFPRTLAQAKALDKAEKVDHVINLDVPFSEIVERIQGRWLHQGSGRIYHTKFNPPKQVGVDDVTGEALIQRDDDKLEVVQARLEQYQQQTTPLLDYFKHDERLVEFSGTSSNILWPKVHAFLSTKLEPLQYTEYK